MHAEWRFEKQRRSQKSREPMQESFFTNESIDDETHALIREAIQNALDARISPVAKVRVRFYIGNHSAASEVMGRYIGEDAWKHFRAKNNGLVSPPNTNEVCRFLVYEDFNTQGLSGDYRASEPMPGNSFYYFMRAEGQSGKQDGDRGRHGIGKYVFPYTSRIRSFLVATVRSSDMQCLIAGQSVLKSHQVDGRSYTPDGWWGAFEQDGPDDYFQLPVDNAQLFNQLKDDFCLSRSSDQPGLSLIIPYIREEVTAEKLVEKILSEYYWPILSDQLIVEVADADAEFSLSKAFVLDGVDDFLNSDASADVSALIKLAAKVLQGSNSSVIELNLPDKPALPKWSAEYLTKGHAEDIQSKLNEADSFVCVRCPLHVSPLSSGIAESSFFDIYICRNDEDKNLKPTFIREGITVSESRVSKIRGYVATVVINSGSLATLLGDSENPAHTEWEKNAVKFKNKYKWGTRTIDFVRLSVSKLLTLLSQGDEEEDSTILSDIFYLNLEENTEDVPSSRRKITSSDTDEVEPPPPPRPRTYRLKQLDDGFLLQGPLDELARERRYTVKVAYDLVASSKVTALKKYHKNDFDFGNCRNVNKPRIIGVDNVEMDKNIIMFTAAHSSFEVEVTGFDSRRDIVVDVISEVNDDEEI